MPNERVAIHAATALVRQEGAFRGRRSMQEYLAEQGFSDDVIEEALRRATEEERRAALEREHRRRQSVVRLGRVRVVLVLVVTLLLGYVAMKVTAWSISDWGPGIGLALVGVLLLPAVAGGLVAGADAGTRVARGGALVLIAGLPLALFLGLTGEPISAFGADDLRFLLFLGTAVTGMTLLGYVVGTSLGAGRR